MKTHEILNPHWNTKTEYLAFVAEWKEAYKELSQAIREIKRNTHLYNCEPTKLDEADKLRHSALQKGQARMKALCERHGFYDYAFWTRKRMADIANQLLNVRAWNKVKAKAAREESLKATPLAA